MGDDMKPSGAWATANGEAETVQYGDTYKSMGEECKAGEQHTSMGDGSNDMGDESKSRLPCASTK
jgi:hypothetical protein